MKRSILVRAGALAIGLMALGSGVANAEDAWPVDPGHGSPSRPGDRTDYVLMPEQPEFWNPAIGKTRVISPYGRTTKIVCTGYRVETRCWQADRDGNPHELKELFNTTVFGSLAPTPATAVFVYPGMIPGS
ncbi:hypothetical protein M2284_001520 [Rhodococcus sp. LBL1]|uniref:Uncharacterized protein n=1 Tax=Prescottella agglutinans TaxID=1644129 RepID=A0ABT6MHX0_9NOCA|nr:hypothetical protein [Prescottella agglutinans]MDH6283907.1 hypothetical protein [Prescottella agglutinans]MDH6677322.1 hypothetical protein [Rhodococcus sp. LBL1]MDH6682384.1 hypothetical protein [Rhodococcus sp. LBL2]